MGALPGILANSGDPHPRFVFEPSGLEITCIGLAGAPLEDVVSRWCCAVDDGRRATPSIELRVRSNGEWYADHERYDASSISEKGLHEERFGDWRMLIRPGTGRDEVRAVIPAATTSGDFLQAIDLCVTHLLALQGGAMLHGAAFEVGGARILAIGHSGSGKSTVAAAALATGGTIVSDDLLLAAALQSGEVGLATMRRSMVLREAGFQILPGTLREHLRPFTVGGKPRWELSPEVEPSSFTDWTVPRRLWLVSVDRRLTSSRIGRVDQAAALAWLIRGTTDRFLTATFHRERDAQLEVLKSLAESCPAFRIRLGRDLLATPATTLERLLSASTG